MIIELLKRGNIWYDVPGKNVTDVLSAVVQTVPFPPTLNQDILLSAMLEREAFMPTAVGKGIAMPHPRNPLVNRDEDQLISILFLQCEVDWKALDGIPVSTVMLIISASAKQHVQTLSYLSFFCQHEAYRNLLTRRSSQEEIVQYMERVEKTWL
ncbi:MAG: PTS sugar transporter subunit IIA [Treponema sp.]|jgi:PTS system nitrogen regulatory IIA component|nr:PTS sugar transporter subunit IIA [Treponema sp.]